MVFFRLQNGCKNYNFANEIGWHMNIIIRFEAQTHELFAGKWMKKKRSFVNAQTSLKTPFFLFQLMSCIFASMPLLSLCFLTRAFGFLFRRLYLTKNLVEELCFISEIKVNMCSVKLLFVLIFFLFRISLFSSFSRINLPTAVFFYFPSSTLSISLFCKEARCHKQTLIKLFTVIRMGLWFYLFTRKRNKKANRL